jgi:hypothetical protein
MRNTFNINGFAGKSEAQVGVTDEILSLGSFFVAATPVPTPAPVDDALAIERAADDPRAIERAEWWLFNDCPDAGADAFASAVEAAVVLRDSYRLSSSLAEAQLNDIWNRVACEPPLTPAQIAEAVRQAYCFCPAGLGAQAGPTPLQPGAPVAPTPSPTGREPTAQPDDRKPASIVETTDPSSVIAATLVTTTMPNLVVNTPPECALCAARRKAKLGENPTLASSHAKRYTAQCGGGVRCLSKHPTEPLSQGQCLISIARSTLRAAVFA